MKHETFALAIYVVGVFWITLLLFTTPKRHHHGISSSNVSENLTHTAGGTH